MQHTFTRHQLLNITTGRLWTTMDDIYKLFNETIEDGIMTHMLPRAMTSFMATAGKREPILSLPKEGYDPANASNEDITFEVTPDDKIAFWEIYSDQPNPLEGKNAILVGSK